MPAWRPTDYTPELADRICELLMSGLSTTKICEKDEMPHRSTLNEWLSKHSEFADKYVRACKIRREDRFEKLEDIVDTIEDVQKARLKVDVIKWQLSKEEPKKYWDKLDMTSDWKAIPTPIISVNEIRSHNSDQKSS